MADQEADLNRLNPADALVLLADVIGSLKAHGFIVLGADKHYGFVNPTTNSLVTEINEVQQLLALHGLHVPDNAQRIIAAIPLILPLVGIR
jgi:uncharacterized membrane protein